MAEPAESAGLVGEQIAYYRARADEYDEWYLRWGRYDHGPEWNGVFQAELEEAHQALCRFAPGGQVLELASGTGWWTGTLARTAAQVTAVDASAETLAHNRRRHGEAGVRYIQADLFAWQPDRLYDAIFFGCWLSHVPPQRFDAFWAWSGRRFAPEGRCFSSTPWRGTSRPWRPPTTIARTRRRG
jgi:demethylmenaquinone methyltransferase/2-methoxy-6-polyprenyl-1,4-benzoquinol methylase